MGESNRACVLTGATIPIGHPAVFFPLLPGPFARSRPTYAPGALHFSVGEGSLLAPATLPIFGQLGEVGDLYEVEETPATLWLAHRLKTNPEDLGDFLHQGELPAALRKVDMKIRRSSRDRRKAKPQKNLWGCYALREVWDHFSRVSYGDGGPVTSAYEAEFGPEVLKLLGFQETSVGENSKGWSHPEVPGVSISQDRYNQVVFEKGSSGEVIRPLRRCKEATFPRDLRSLSDLDEVLLAQGRALPGDLILRAKSLHPLTARVQHLRHEYNELRVSRKYDKHRYLRGASWPVTACDLTKEEREVKAEWDRYALRKGILRNLARLRSVEAPETPEPTRRLKPRTVTLCLKHPTRTFALLVYADMDDRGTFSNTRIGGETEDKGSLLTTLADKARGTLDLDVELPEGYVESLAAGGIALDERPISELPGLSLAPQMVALYRRKLYKEFAEDTACLLLFQENLRLANGHFHPRPCGPQGGVPEVAQKVADLLRASSYLRRGAQ